MGLVRHIAKHATIAHHVVADVMPFEQHLAVIRPQHAGNHLYGGRLPRPVGPQKTHHLAGTDAKAHILDRGNSAIAPIKMLYLEHENLRFQHSSRGMRNSWRRTLTRRLVDRNREPPASQPDEERDPYVAFNILLIFLLSSSFLHRVEFQAWPLSRSFPIPPPWSSRQFRPALSTASPSSRRPSCPPT